MTECGVSGFAGIYSRVPERYDRMWTLAFECVVPAIARGEKSTKVTFVPCSCTILLEHTLGTRVFGRETSARRWAPLWCGLSGSNFWEPQVLPEIKRLVPGYSRRSLTEGDECAEG